MARSFTVTLTDPSGYKDEYDVDAKNKADARSQVSRIYRSNVPRQAKLHGFYSFSSNRVDIVERD